MEAPQFSELSNEQRRQIVDVQQAFGGWQSTLERLHKLGSVYWHRSKGHRYLYEKHGSVRQSHGRDSPENRRRHAQHREQRKALEAIAKGLKRRLDDMAPVNRALRLGRLPQIAARILHELERAKLLGAHIIVAGTNALYAYEAATGTVIASQHVATTDADLLWDTNQSLLLATTGISPEGIMGILRRVDRSFRADYGMNATNRDGYIVDLLCPESPTSSSMTRSDLEAIEMPGAQWLLDAPRFEHMVIGEDGLPVRMVVPEPRTFALHKLWVSRRVDRTPIKRPRDAAHARVVSDLARTYLGLPLTARDMPWLSSELKAQFPDLKQQRPRKSAANAQAQDA